MPRYIAHSDTWLSHECRMVKAGNEFETTFPKAKNAKGEEVEMRLGANLSLVEEEKAKGGRARGGDSLV